MWRPEIIWRENHDFFPFSPSPRQPFRNAFFGTGSFVCTNIHRCATVLNGDLSLSHIAPSLLPLVSIHSVRYLVFRFCVRDTGNSRIMSPGDFHFSTERETESAHPPVRLRNCDKLCPNGARASTHLFEVLAAEWGSEHFLRTKND